MCHEQSQCSHTSQRSSSWAHVCKKKYHWIRRKSTRFIEWKTRWQNVRKFKQYKRSLVKVLQHSVSWQHRDQRYTIYYVAVRENTDPQLQQIKGQLMQFRFHRTRVDQLFFSKTNRHPTRTPKKEKMKLPAPIPIYFNWTNAGSPSDIIGFRLQTYGSVKSARFGYIFLSRKPSRMRCRMSLPRAGSRFKQTFSKPTLRVISSCNLCESSQHYAWFIYCRQRYIYICGEYARRSGIYCCPVYNGSVRFCVSSKFLWCLRFLRFRTILFLRWRRVAAAAAAAAVDDVEIPQNFYNIQNDRNKPCAFVVPQLFYTTLESHVSILFSFHFFLVFRLLTNRFTVCLALTFSSCFLHWEYVYIVELDQQAFCRCLYFAQAGVLAACWHALFQTPLFVSTPHTHARASKAQSFLGMHFANSFVHRPSIRQLTSRRALCLCKSIVANVTPTEMKKKKKHKKCKGKISVDSLQETCSVCRQHLCVDKICIHSTKAHRTRPTRMMYELIEPMKNGETVKDTMERKTVCWTVFTLGSRVWADGWSGAEHENPCD